MRPQRLLIVLFLWFSFVHLIDAQCPTLSTLQFTTQQEIDDFLIDYPDCTLYSGDIILGGDYTFANSSIVNLDGFQNLTNIDGFLNVSYCHGLTNLSGLDNLISIGDYLRLGNNDNLQNLNGLDNLSSVRFINIRYNESLQNLSALQNITSLEGLTIYTNISLESLSGFENLISIDHGLSIRHNDNLQNLSSLGNLDSIGTTLDIQYNDNLQNFNGLENITLIPGTVSIEGNSNLLSLSGLENLNSIGDDLFIRYNNALQSLDGLISLNSIGSYFGLAHSNLQTLNGLENLTSIGTSMSIQYNDNLQSLSGLHNLTSIGGSFRIKNNPQLSVCAIPPICNSIVDGSVYLDIEDNAPGCNTLPEIASQCEDLGKIFTPFYYDVNQNANQDSGEPFFPNASVLIESGDYVVYGNATTGGIKYLHNGTYSISFIENQLPNWELTNNILSYTTTLDSVIICDTFSFGLYPTSYFTKLNTSCINDLPRCNEFVTFEPLVINEGTTTANGTLWFDIDPAVLTVTYIDAPDTLDGPFRVGWHFTNLYPGHTFKPAISLQLPGPPDFPVGDFLNFGTQVNFEDQNGFSSNALNTHRVEVRCSFDPNDKLVSPQYPENYALIDEELIYTIRFQNTGNAEAYDVVIKDLLSEDLDLSTFRYITSSHEEVLSTYIEDRMLTFEFKDIFLPDSTTSFDGSQGYVMYSVLANSAIEDYTKIENTANIFFDYNPAVVTNTTGNTMLSTFDFDEDGFLLWEDCDDNNALVNTGTAEISYNGLDDDCNELTLDDDLDQDGFVLADDCDDNNPLVNSEVAETPYNGIDDDCNELTLDDDLDQDGFALADDCDDENPEINPNAVEIPNNGIDEDCDGQDLITSAVNNIVTIKPQIFPNPITDILQVSFPNPIQGTYELETFNGKLILKNQLNQQNFINFENQPKGIYLLLMKTKEGVWSERVVKM